MRKSFAETMEVGRLLIQAKAAVDHGEWLPLLRSVGLHERTAQMWMRVVRNPRFANASPELAFASLANHAFANRSAFR